MYVGPVEAGVGLLLTRTVRDMEVESERHMDVLERVLVSNNPTPAPLQQNEETRCKKLIPETHWEAIHSGNTSNFWRFPSDRFERLTDKAPGFSGGYLLVSYSIQPTSARFATRSNIPLSRARRFKRFCRTLRSSSITMTFSKNASIPVDRPASSVSADG